MASAGLKVRRGQPLPHRQWRWALCWEGQSLRSDHPNTGIPPCRNFHSLAASGVVQRGALAEHPGIHLLRPKMSLEDKPWTGTANRTESSKQCAKLGEQCPCCMHQPATAQREMGKQKCKFLRRRKKGNYQLAHSPIHLCCDQAPAPMQHEGQQKRGQALVNTHVCAEGSTLKTRLGARLPQFIKYPTDNKPSENKHPVGSFLTTLLALLGVGGGGRREDLMGKLGASKWKRSYELLGDWTILTWCYEQTPKSSA